MAGGLAIILTVPDGLSAKMAPPALLSRWAWRARGLSWAMTTSSFSIRSRAIEPPACTIAMMLPRIVIPKIQCRRRIELLSLHSCPTMFCYAGPA
jgi:hypothetical protein